MKYGVISKISVLLRVLGFEHPANKAARHEIAKVKALAIASVANLPPAALEQVFEHLAQAAHLMKHKRPIYVPGIPPVSDLGFSYRAGQELLARARELINEHGQKVSTSQA